MRRCRCRKASAGGSPCRGSRRSLPSQKPRLQVPSCAIMRITGTYRALADPLKHDRRSARTAGARAAAASPRARAPGGAARPISPGSIRSSGWRSRRSDGPVLVLAGAGTGKTRVLTVRIAHILATGRARPGEILAVTFTNKAAREMKHRVGEIVGHVVEGMPWLGTFHSIGVKILRRHAELVGLKPDFTILDVDDQIRLLKQLLEAENIDEKRWPARVLAVLIDGWKNRGLTPEQVPPGEAAVFANGKGLQTLQGLSGAAENPQRRRFRRSAAGEHPAVPRAARGAAAISGRASNSSWSTNIRTPTSRSICGCGCWRSALRASAHPSPLPLAGRGSRCEASRVRGRFSRAAARGSSPSPRPSLARGRPRPLRER